MKNIFLLLQIQQLGIISHARVGKGSKALFVITPIALPVLVKMMGFVYPMLQLQSATVRMDTLEDIVK